MENDELKPISPIGYIGYDILYMIPVVGLVMMIVFLATSQNRNVKNYAAAKLIALAIGSAISILLFVVIGVGGISALLNN